MTSKTTEAFTVEDLRTYQRVAERIDPHNSAWMKEVRPGRDEAILHYLNLGQDIKASGDWERLFCDGVEFFDEALGYVALPRRIASDDNLKAEYLATLKALQILREVKPVVGERDFFCHNSCCSDNSDWPDTGIDLAELRDEFSVLLEQTSLKLSISDESGLVAPDRLRRLRYLIGYREVTGAQLLAEVRDIKRRREKSGQPQYGDDAPRQNPNQDAF